jgi:hypothetical protein
VPSLHWNDLHLRSADDYLLHNRLLQVTGQLSKRLIGPTVKKLRLIWYSLSQKYFKMGKLWAIQLSSLVQFQVRRHTLCILSCKEVFRFDVRATVHNYKFPYNKPTRCINFSKFILKWNSTCFVLFLCPSLGVSHCAHNNVICHTCLLTACKRDQDDPACKLLANLYDIYHCCVYSEKLLMMDRETVRNM